MSVWAEMALWGFSREVLGYVSLMVFQEQLAGSWGRTTVAASYFRWGLSVQEVDLLVFCICVGRKFPLLRN